MTYYYDAEKGFDIKKMITEYFYTHFVPEVLLPQFETFVEQSNKTIDNHFKKCIEDMNIAKNNCIKDINNTKLESINNVEELKNKFIKYINEEKDKCTNQINKTQFDEIIKKCIDDDIDININIKM